MWCQAGIIPAERLHRFAYQHHIIVVDQPVYIGWSDGWVDNYKLTTFYLFIDVLWHCNHLSQTDLQPFAFQWRNDLVITWSN